MREFQKYIALAKKMGAEDAKVIRAKDVFVRDWVFLKCKFGCDGFGKRLTCPPNSPSPETMRRVLSEYSRALLLHFVRNPRKKQSMHPTRVASALERTIFLDGYYKAWGMGCGPCLLCERCDPKKCRHAEEARPSMESCGIDVYATARKAGFPIEVVTDYKQVSNRYALILIE